MSSCSALAFRIVEQWFTKLWGSFRKNAKFLILSCRCGKPCQQKIIKARSKTKKKDFKIMAGEIYRNKAPILE